MSEVVTVKLSPNRSNIMYVVRRTELETDFSESLSTLKKKLIDTPRVIYYCRTLMMICADLFSHFSMKWEKVGTTLLVHMMRKASIRHVHASTPQHSKDVIMRSFQDCYDTVRVVFASVAMG